jgi:hypothetical protein
MRVKPLPRRVKAPTASFVPGLPAREEKSEVSKTIERSHARYVRELPAKRLEVVIDAIKDGTRLVDIAAFFAGEGWLTVTEKTFVQYLIAFKRLYPELLDDTDAETSTSNTSMTNKSNLSGLVSKNKPALDTEKTIEQLIRVQSMRLRRGTNFELSTGLVNQHLHKDILATKELLESLERIRGGGAKVGSKHHTPVNSEAAEQLRKAETSEVSADKLGLLVGQLVSLNEQKQAHAQETQKS